ncbi:acyltransferase family protein [Sphingobium sp. HBC34]|uniref:Acyltransferase family protein n=1 Tax=Sphingobium cyanobacteriorum TaxID=3063954 RepID=A0ABT8ZLG8_9SPHN|nr:acyltransferase family protein [Sphingobium sp. HBC34]MDO7835056.1 acyltransferase family protein [Sphingobium sp. HBC34]
MENRGHSQAHARLDWIDVARSIGIVAVVVGHVWTRGPLRDAMYAFHMPLFFLLSGMLSRPCPVLAFTRRQLAGQMRPYVAFLILLIVADQIMERLKGHLPIFHTWPDDIVPVLLGGSWLRGPFTIFWFVPCLMVARILFNLALTRWPDPLDRRWAALLLPMVLLAYALGWWTQVSPLGLISVPMAFVLLWMGAAWPHMRWHNGLILPLGLLAAAGLSGLLPTLNMKAADYGAPLLSIGAAVAASCLIFRLSERIAPFAVPLAMLGRASLVVMYLHVAIIHYLSPYLGKAVLLGLALVLPFAAYHLIRATPLRRLFL